MATGAVVYEFPPYHDLSKTSEIANCIRYWIDEYIADGQEEPKILVELTGIFSDPKVRSKVIDSRGFTSVFLEKMDERRVATLVCLLSNIEGSGIELKNCLTTAVIVSEYVRYWLNKYNDEPQDEARIIEKLKIVFDDTAIRRKILTGNAFGRIFREKIREKRKPALKKLLQKINPGRFDAVDWRWTKHDD